jgi:hypothetical protein
MCTRAFSQTLAVLALLCASVTTHAEPTPAPERQSKVDVVFSLDGVLMNQVPSHVKKNDPKGTYIEFDQRTFRLSNHAVRMIKRLASDPKIRISFFSGRPKAFSDTFLDAVKLDSAGTSLKSIAHKILGKEDLTDQDPKIKEPDLSEEPLSKKYKKDLSKISEDTKDVILIDADAGITDKSQKKNLLALDDNLYFFKKFEDVAPAAEKLKKDDEARKAKLKAKYDSSYLLRALDHLPKDEAAWSQNVNRIDRIYQVVRKTIDEPAQKGKTLGDALQTHAAKGASEAIKEGRKALAKHIDWALDASGKKVSGCVEKSEDDATYSETVDLALCMKEKKLSFGWAPGTADCARLTESGAVLVSGVKVDSCALPGRFGYAWIDERANRCGQYTEPGKVLIGPAAANQCEDPIVKDLKPCLTRLDRPYRFYHYTSEEKIDARKPGGMSYEEAVRKHQRLWSEHFWNTNNPYNGLWTVRDPVSSERYGDHLFRIEVPAGSTIYDVKSPAGAGCQFSAPSIKLLTEAGCPLEPYAFLFSGAAGNCKPLLRKTHQALKLRAYTSSHTNVHYSGCTNEDRSFVWVNLSDLPDSAFANFPQGNPTATGARAAEATEINYLWKEASGAYRWEMPMGYEEAHTRNAKGRILGCPPAVAPKKKMADTSSCPTDKALAFPLLEKLMDRLGHDEALAENR